jgi:hypothetical protein
MAQGHARFPIDQAGRFSELLFQLSQPTNALPQGTKRFNGAALN